MTVGVWRSNCPYRAADPEDIDPCPHCDANNPVSTPAVGHVCESSLTGRTPSEPAAARPSLCWICSKALPHDCVEGILPTGATQGSVTVSPAGPNVLIGTIHDQPRFLVERADVADLIACLARAYGGEQLTAHRLDGFALAPGAQATHGPPQKVELSTPMPGVSILLHPESAKRLAPPITPTGRKWPIGTPDEHAWKLASDGCRDDHGPSYEWHLRLAAARTHCNLTLDALARRLDPPRTRKDISAMEHGRRGLSVELCAQLADALDCDRLWLAGWTLEGTP